MVRDPKGRYVPGSSGNPLGPTSPVLSVPKSFRRTVDDIRSRTTDQRIHTALDKLEVFAEATWPDEESDPAASAGRWSGCGFSVLQCRIADRLNQRPGQGVSHEALYNFCYFDRSPSDMPDTEIIKVEICKMRKKLAGTKYAIETVWGAGYRLMVNDPAH